MHRPSAEEFLLTLLETLDGLPPDLALRFAELLKKDTPDRSSAIDVTYDDGIANGVHCRVIASRRLMPCFFEPAHTFPRESHSTEETSSGPANVVNREVDGSRCASPARVASHSVPSSAAAIARTSTSGNPFAVVNERHASRRR